MYQDNWQNQKKKKRDKILTIIILILLFISIILSVILVLKDRNIIFAQERNDFEVKEVSDQEKLDYIEEYDGDYTELVGYGKITITSKRPYVYLENIENNDVYLQFDVYNADALLYSSKLIQPGDFDSLNVYELLEKGEHLLTYRITSYDINTQEVLLSLMQQQEINIIGG